MELDPGYLIRKMPSDLQLMPVHLLLAQKECVVAGSAAPEERPCNSQVFAVSLHHCVMYS